MEGKFVETPKLKEEPFDYDGDSSTELKPDIIDLDESFTSNVPEAVQFVDPSHVLDTCTSSVNMEELVPLSHLKQEPDSYFDGAQQSFASSVSNTFPEAMEFIDPSDVHDTCASSDMDSLPGLKQETDSSFVGAQKSSVDDVVKEGSSVEGQSQAPATDPCFVHLSRPCTMEDRNYAIVKFIDEDDAPGIVATCWIAEDERTCQYPNVRTNQMRDKLLKNLVEPQADWITCRIIKLAEYATFADTKYYLEKAKETSNLESEPVEEVRRSKRRPHPVSFLGGEEGSEETFYQKRALPVKKRKPQIPCPPLVAISSSSQNPRSSIPQLQSSYIFESPSPPNKVIEQFNSKISFPQRFQTTHLQPSVESTGRKESLIPNSLGSSSGLQCSGCTSKQNIINGQLLETIADMSAAIARIEQKVDSLLATRVADLARARNQDIEEEDLMVLGDLPVSTLEKFYLLERKLNEGGRFLKKFFKTMASVGGKSGRALAQNMMKCLLTDTVAEMFSLSGKASKHAEKKSFAETAAYKIVVAACKEMYKDEMDKDIREAVSDWLNQAKVRRIRREQQHKRSNEG